MNIIQIRQKIQKYIWNRIHKNIGIFIYKCIYRKLNRYFF